MRGPPPPMDVLMRAFQPAFRMAVRIVLPVRKVAWQVWFDNCGWTELVWATSRNAARKAAVQLGYTDAPYLDACARRAPWADDLEGAGEQATQIAKRLAGWCHDDSDSECIGCRLFPAPLVVGSAVNADGLCGWCANDLAEHRQALLTVMARRQAHLNKWRP